MDRSIALLTLLVRDDDEAIAFFTAALRFSIIEDTPLDDAPVGLGWACGLTNGSTCKVIITPQPAYAGVPAGHAQ